MELQLAIVLKSAPAGHTIQLVNTKQTATAHYAEAMQNYSIVAHSGDLVAVMPETGEYEMRFRWRRTVATEVEVDSAVISNQQGDTKRLPFVAGLVGVTEGSDVFTDNSSVWDVVVDGFPANPGRIADRAFPKIRQMYGELERAEQVDPKQLVAQSYTAIAETYLAWSQTVRIAEREKYTQVLSDNLAQGSAVLDLGCGSGVATTMHLSQRLMYTGVDISPAQIDLAKELVPAGTFYCADMTKITFEPASFDGILSFYALIHVPREELAGLLGRIAEWLRPGGLFVASFPTKADKAWIDDDWLGTQMYWSGFDSETNQRLVEEAGLVIEQANIETEMEFDQPISFLWIVARKELARRPEVNE